MHLRGQPSIQPRAKSLGTLAPIWHSALLPTVVRTASITGACRDRSSSRVFSRPVSLRRLVQLHQLARQQSAHEYHFFRYRHSTGTTYSLYNFGNAVPSALGSRLPFTNNTFFTAFHSFPTVDRWTHFAITIDDSTRAAKIYVDGVERGSTTLPSRWFTIQPPMLSRR